MTLNFGYDPTEPGVFEDPFLSGQVAGPGINISFSGGGTTGTGTYVPPYYPPTTSTTGRSNLGLLLLLAIVAALIFLK